MSQAEQQKQLESSSQQPAEIHPGFKEQGKEQRLTPPRKHPTSLTHENLTFLPQFLPAFPTTLTASQGGEAGVLKLQI